MISTKINAEIKEYQEKFFLGMSIRQLICIALAVILAVGTGVVGVYYFHFDMNLLSYVIMLEVLPFLGLGFIRRDGYPFEKYAAVFLRWYTDNPKIPVKPYEEVHHVQKRQRKCECQTGAALTAAAGKYRKKAARERIALAKKETRQEQHRLRQKGKAAASAAYGQ